MANLNIAEFRDKVLGCWTGKNIGGTLGTPFEGTREMPEVDLYAQILKTGTLPNDDLDLQLIWLFAAEELGAYRVTPKKLAEYWMSFQSAPMSEYSNCLNNIANGFYPPLSGSFNNDEWKWSNGAWIRSEIWACIFPGSPDDAARGAYIDSCLDHDGEGIWAEVFTAALESAAFVENNVEKAISIALKKIDPECRIGASVSCALELYHQGVDFVEARQKIIEKNVETGFFQAPQNIGFMVLALLYGEGDFEKTVTLAIRCGDDTDCTAATAASVLGIMLGRSRMPEKWCSAIGNSIVTICLSPFGMRVPKTLDALTDRVIALARRTLPENPDLLPLSEAPTDLSDFTVSDSDKIMTLIKKHSSNEVMMDLPFARIGADLEGGPTIRPGEPKRIRFILHSISQELAMLNLTMLLPEGWTAPEGSQFIIAGTRSGPQCGEVEAVIVPGEITEAITFIPVRFTLSDRKMPELRYIPLQRENSVDLRLLVRNSDETYRKSRRYGDKKVYPSAELDF